MCYRYSPVVRGVKRAQARAALGSARCVVWAPAQPSERGLDEYRKSKSGIGATLVVLGAVVSVVAASHCNSSSPSASPNGEAGGGGSSGASTSSSGAGADDGATPGSSSGSSTGGGAGPDAAGSSDASGAMSYDAPADVAADASLYDRIGGHANLRIAIADVITHEMADPIIGTYFFAQTASPVPAGHPTKDQIVECLTDWLGMQIGGSEGYPTTVTTATGSFACRSMQTAHAHLHIASATLDKFMMMAGVLSAPPYNLSSSDLSAIDVLFNSTRIRIVDPNAGGLGPYDASAD